MTTIDLDLSSEVRRGLRVRIASIDVVRRIGQAIGGWHAVFDAATAPVRQWAALREARTADLYEVAVPDAASRPRGVSAERAAEWVARVRAVVELRDAVLREHDVTASEVVALRHVAARSVGAVRGLLARALAERIDAAFVELDTYDHPSVDVLALADSGGPVEPAEVARIWRDGAARAATLHDLPPPFSGPACREMLHERQRALAAARFRLSFAVGLERHGLDGGTEIWRAVVGRVEAEIVALERGIVEAEARAAEVARQHAEDIAARRAAHSAELYARLEAERSPGQSIVEVASVEGPRPVLAIVVGRWWVHLVETLRKGKSPLRRWNVTHGPTGMRAGDRTSKAAALALAKRLEAEIGDLADFSSPANATCEVKQRIRVIVGR